MQIIILDLDSDPPEWCDIEIPLRRLASSPQPVVAARWSKFLELVEVLRADGPHPEVQGLILCDELMLTRRGNLATVRVRVDWRDYAPLRDGLPEMHYRVQIEPRFAKLSREVRTRSPEEVEGIIREAFGWSR
jgi:hypothetical protein